MEGQLTPLAKYQETRARIEDSIRLLKELGGTYMEGNPHRDTIHRLEGMLSGMRLCEIAVDM